MQQFGTNRHNTAKYKLKYEQNKNQLVAHYCQLPDKTYCGISQVISNYSWNFKISLYLAQDIWQKP